jgi:hypothetical protein
MPGPKQPGGVAMKALIAVVVSCLIVLAPVEPEKKPLSVKDAKSGITVTVEKDNRSLLAKDRTGKDLWKVDVIKTAGAPAVGMPVVRHLSLKDGKLRAIYGKHSFADFDLKTGKLIATGSD